MEPVFRQLGTAVVLVGWLGKPLFYIPFLYIRGGIEREQKQPAVPSSKFHVLLSCSKNAKPIFKKDAERLKASCTFELGTESVDMNMEIIASKMGAPDEDAELFERLAIKYGVTDKLEYAYLMGQVYVESGGFTRFTENLNYSAEGLLATFGTSRISSKDAWRVGRVDKWGQKADQRAIANLVYGGEWGRLNLGNIRPNDGWDFRGQAWKQITGRSNTEQYSLWAYGDDRVVRDPTMLQRNPDRVLSAFWYWITRGLGVYARADNILAVSQGVNLGPRKIGTSAIPNGYKERVAATSKAKSL